MIFDRLKNLFMKKPGNGEIDILKAINEAKMNAINNRQKLLSYMETFFQQKFYCTMVGLIEKDMPKTKDILQILFSENETAMIISELEKSQILPENFFVWTLNGTCALNEKREEFFILFRQMSTALVITVVSTSSQLIQSIDEELSRFTPSVDEIFQDTISHRVFFLTGVDKERNEVAGAVEKRRISPQILAAWWRQTTNIAQRESIVLFVESWRLPGCDDLFLEELKTCETFSDYHWRLALLLWMTGKSNGNNVKKAMLLLKHIKDPSIRHWLLMFIGKAKHTELFDFYIESLKDKSLSQAAMSALGKLGNKDAVPHIKPFLTCGNKELSKTALKALSKLLPLDQLPPPPSQPEHLQLMPDKLKAKISRAVHSCGNPVKVLEEALQEKLEEFSTSMDTDWLVPTLHKIDSVGVPGDWDAAGEYLACEFEKLRDGACRAWTLNGGAVTFYIVMEREESDTLSLWIASANKAIMEKFNAAAIEQIEICEAESMGGEER